MCIPIETKDTIRVGLSGKEVTFMSEYATELCDKLPFQTVRKEVAPDWRERRNEWDCKQQICDEDDWNDVFHIPVKVDEGILNFFK